MSRSPSPPAQQHTKQPSSPSSTTIDRQKTTPFLLNFCYRSSAFHNLADFPIPTPSDPSPPLPAHLQIYTWYSCTLKELAHLLTTALPSIVPDPAVGTRLSFRLVYPDTSMAGGGGGGGGRGIGRLDEGRPKYVSREMGSVVIGAVGAYTNGRGAAGGGGGEDGGDTANNGAHELGGEDAEKTLADARFVIGDYIDCAVFAPLSDGSVVPRSSIGSGRGGGFRENGYGRGRGSYGLGRGSSYGGGGGGGAAGRNDFGAIIPAGEWRRGERLPEGAGGAGGGGGYRGGGGGGAGSGGYRGRGGRRDLYGS